MLGDIGIVHDKVDELKSKFDVLNSSIAETERLFRNRKFEVPESSENQNSTVLDKASQQKTFAIAAASLAGFGIFMFGAGLALGSVDLGFISLAALAALIGFLGGLLTLHLLTASENTASTDALKSEAIKTREPLFRPEDRAKFAQYAAEAMDDIKKTKGK